MAKILIVEARYYAHLNDMLLAGARRALRGHEVEIATVPGALEIPPAIAMAEANYDAFVALGVVIRGETYHFEVVSNESARGITDLGLQGLAIGNGVLKRSSASNASDATKNAPPIAAMRVDTSARSRHTLAACAAMPARATT